MKICGVEIKSNEAIICLLELDGALFNLPDCRAQRVVVRNGDDVEEMRKFQFTFAKLMSDYGVDKVMIKQRPAKGKFAGSALGFKLEAAIQLIDGLNVELIAANQIQETLKQHPLMIDFRETGLKQFQQTAFTTAYTGFKQK
ncbi:MAG: DUF3010 family protein [Marinobacterium sp.]|nr:DUF3010 family protein [Marinobacterium sp.]